MSEAAGVADTVAELIGTTFSGANPASVAVPPAKAESVEKFEFDADFQSRIVYLTATDSGFLKKVGHLLKPEYFESSGEATLMAVAMQHWKNYGSSMNDYDVMKLALQDAVKTRLARPEAIKECIPAVQAVIKQQAEARTGEAHGLNADFVAEKIAEFVRHQAVIDAITRSVGLIDRRDFDKIEKLVSEATSIGVSNEEGGGDYFERLLIRSNERAEESAGRRPPKGITTGHPKIDNLLYHRGWGRKELSCLMGGPKAGKTTALIEFGSGACMAGFNVLYVTLEVSNRIVEERADARFSEIPIGDLVGKFADVNLKIGALADSKKCGRFFIAEYPTGGMSPAMLRSLLERHKAKGLTYDLVIVDYADIMAPDFRTNDPIENSKQIYIGLRAVAHEWNAAVLTATQSNRAGFQAVTAKAEHVADDINKVRTVDLFISINVTEEERKDGKARLYFAASRNQRSGMTVFITQDFNTMKFIKAIERIE